MGNKEQYIIAVSNTYNENVDLFCESGTEEEIRRTLVSMAIEDRFGNLDPKKLYEEVDISEPGKMQLALTIVTATFCYTACPLASLHAVSKQTPKEQPPKKKGAHKYVLHTIDGYTNKSHRDEVMADTPKEAVYGVFDKYNSLYDGDFDNTLEFLSEDDVDITMSFLDTDW